MNRLLRHAWLAGAALLLLAGVFPAAAQVRVKKIDVRHVGPPAASDELVKANIRVKEGEPYNRAAVDDDVRNLYATGFFFNIRVAEESTGEGVLLTYFVQGKPRISDIKFQGNKKYSTAKLSKKVAVKVGEPLDEQKLFTDTQKLREMYQKAGLQKTEVKYLPPAVDLNSGKAVVTFEIIETPKVKVIDVVFDGAKAFPQKKLRKVIKTRRSWMFGWITGAGKLKDEQFEDDKDRLSEFYRNEGYIDFELKDVKFEQPTATKMLLRFIVSEGRQYKVGAVSVKGVSLFPVEDIMGVLKMHVGQTFTPKGLSTDLEAIRDFYGAKGYIGTAPGATGVDVLPRKNPNVETGTMDLVYEISEGDKSFIEKIEIKGNVKTKDKVIRRELSVAPGEVFDMVRVKRSKSRLDQMQYFERIDTRPEDTDVPNRKNLVVSVDEKNTGNFTVGAGFSSVDSLVGFAELTQGNFDLFKPPTFQGAGQKFRLRVSLGLERQDYLVSFVEPWFMGKKLAFGVDLYHRNWNFLSDLFDERRTGMKLSLTRALGSDFLIGSVSVGAESIGLNNVNYDSPSTIYHSSGDYFVGRVGASIAYDTRNSVTLPDHGQRTELFGEFVAGDFQLYKAELRSAWYFPGLAEGHVIEVIGRLGMVESLGDGIKNPEAGQVTPWWSTNTVVDANSGATNYVAVQHFSTNLPPNQVPFFERYFLGGPYSLRGFRYRHVGPQEQGLRGIGREPIGGNSYYMFSVEYSVPIIDKLRVATFYDMGNVFYKISDFDPSRFSANVGFGIRLNLPIGPLRLDYGYPIREANGEGRSGRFNFTVGYTREF
ncbi:MAG: outer membrane protein assembly factor BamA [Verrucomicrobia bacterium]|nr:outer membrane protein assembly factor BamA [Verrucomicrobiota bacterium]